MPPRSLALADAPFWPRMLTKIEAARYLGVGVTVFEAEIRATIWPPGTPRGERGGRLTWDRVQLDALCDQGVVPRTRRRRDMTHCGAKPTLSLVPREYG